AEGGPCAQKTICQLGSLPNPEDGFLPQRLPALAAVLEDLAWQWDVDRADLLARIALRAQRVGQVGLVEAVMKGREHEPDRSVVDVPELVAAHGHESRARVGARTTANACQGVTEDRIGPHLFASVVKDHTVHLSRTVNADRQGLLDVTRPRRAGDPVDVAGHDLAGTAAGEHSQDRDRVIE